ncbi:DUF3883 domain-containing protein [Opitutaceae bacterium TAV3]|nr:DUF3883 domain-containing protein [Opitutaceae bacterium TAV3]
MDAPPDQTQWKEWLADTERRQREVFRLSPDRLVAEYRREREITRGYHGREILELLQNAGDAARQAGVKGCVRIVVTPHGLVIGNTGRPFDMGGVRSLQTANLSPKRQSETAVIGDKGLGFRSILNWTQSPLTSSGALGLAFVPDYAAVILEELEQGNEELAALIKAERALGDELIVPRLVFPQWVPDWAGHVWPNNEAVRSIAAECQSLRAEGFDTAIGMPFRATLAFDEAVQQTDALRPEFLLLVNSINQLEIRVDGRAAKVWSCERCGDQANLRENGRELSAWTVSLHEGEVPAELLDEADRRKSRFQILLAVPDNAAASPSSLFCYFPTEAGVPLPLLVHATVELDETRKHVNDTRANRHILAVAAELTLANFTRSIRAADELARVYGCEREHPRIGVCGLNPHAGEEGLLGNEERDVIDPILDTLRAQFPGLSRSEPGDTLFGRQLRGEFDVVVALYHDQGLAPLKVIDFDESVNITLGLAHVRTSPDHGTAFGIAGQGKASIRSFANRPGAGAWDGCRLVATKGNWGSELEKFGVPAALKEAAKTKPLIPVLGGGHESAAKAKLPPSEEVDWWPSRLFADMVAVSSDVDQELATELEVEPFTTKDLLARVLGADTLSVEERARVVAGLVRSGERLPASGLAPLLCDDAGVPLAADTNAIFQPDSEMPKLPGWATIRFLHPELRKRLAEFLEAEGRDLQTQLRPFGVREYSLSALIGPVMAEANRQSSKQPDDEGAVRTEALRFLWRVYQRVGGNTPFPSEATVRLLNQEGQWTAPNTLYLGDGYGQEGRIIQDMYGGWAKAKLVATPAALGLDEGETGGGGQNLDRFLMWLGVARWPREILASSITPMFVEVAKDSIRFPADFDETRIANRQEISSAWFSDAKTVDGLLDILRHALPEAVLAWLTLDERASAWTRVSPDHGKLKIKPYKARYERAYSGPVPSYIHWQIATQPWLPSTAGIKQAPQSCLDGDRQLDVLFPSPAHLDADHLERYGITDRVHDAFRHAGVMPGLAQFTREQLYRLLLEVPELSPDGKAGRALSRWFVSNDVYGFGSADTYQEQFMRKGRIWGTKEGVSAYYPIKELRHVDHEGFPAALTTKLAIADLGKRVGAPKVKAILGIKPLEISEIHPELVSHRASTEEERRADWFNKAKPFIKRLRQSQTKQVQAMGLFDRLELIVCDALEVRMQYEQTTYDHSAQEGEFFIFADRLYVRGDLDDSLDLLADTVGTAVASVFDMADGDAFAKILRCESRDRAKLLKRMCGDTFHEVIEEAKTTVAPIYSEPIKAQSEAEAPEAAEPATEQEPTPEAEPEEDAQAGEETTGPGVVAIPHVPEPAATPRRIVIQEVQKTASKPSGAKTVVDGARCERMAMAFEEQDTPRRWALQVGHITGTEAPGVDLVSFDSEEDQKAFETEEPRNWSKVARFIEVKGRSSATAKIELKGNELRAARNYTDRYYLYRFYEEGEGRFFVSILRDPVAAEEAQTTIVEFDLERANTTQRYKFTSIV